MEENAHLFSKPETSKQEGHTQNEQQIGQDGAQDGRLDDSDFIFDESTSVKPKTGVSVHMDLMASILRADIAVQG